MGHRLPPTTTRRRRHLARRGRRPGGPDPAPRPGRQLLAHGRARSRRPVLGDLLRPRARVRPRGRPRGGRGPLPRGLEPRLHAGAAQRRPVSKVDFDVAGALPSRNIDTGMGLERMAALLQGVDNIYEIDTMWKVLDRAAELTEQKYGRDHRSDVSLRVVADHVRTAVMLVADGVMPSNEGRGYVLRRILRRSVRNLRLLSGRAARRRGRQPEPGRQRTSTTCTSCPRSRSARSATSTPSCCRDAPHIHTVIDAEESAFLGTLRTGTAIFDAAVEETRRRGGGDDPRQPGVPAARHLRLPDRPDPGDGCRAGPGGRRARVPPADGRAAAAGQGRRGGQEDRQRRHLGLRADPGHLRPGRLHRLRRGRGRRDRDRPAGERRLGARGGRGHRGRRGAGPDPVLRRGRRPAGRRRA